MTINLQQLLPAITISSIIAIGSIVLRFLVLVRSSKIERIFYTSEKNLLIQISQVSIISVPFSLLLTEVLQFFIPYEGNYTVQQKNELYLAYLVVSYFASLVFVGQIYTALFSDFLGKYSFYIEHGELGKMYIVKSMNKKEVILFEGPRIYFHKDDSKSLIITKDELKQHVIFQEKLKNEQVNMFFSPFKKHNKKDMK